MNASELKLVHSTCTLYYHICLRDYERLIRENDMHVQTYGEYVDNGGRVHAPVEDYTFRIETLRDKLYYLWVCIRTADILMTEYDTFTDEDIRECRVRAITDAEILTI